jgi:hypothetical protein
LIVLAEKAMAIQNWMDAAKLLYLGDFEFPYFGKIAT